MVIAAWVASLGIVLGEGRADSAEGPDNESSSTVQCYGFQVYTLDCVGNIDTDNGTLLTFDEQVLPFDFGAIEFGDFRLDIERVSSYYGGLCLVIDAFGEPGNLTFREENGKHIQDIQYVGQPLVVLNGWEYISRDSQGIIIDHRWGSMQIAAYDWRDGTWAPSDGIVIEASTGTTISGASLCLMVFEPSGTTSIPEFDLLTGCVAGVALIMLARRNRRKSPDTVPRDPNWID